MFQEHGQRQSCQGEDSVAELQEAGLSPGRLPEWQARRQRLLHPDKRWMQRTRRARGFQKWQRAVQDRGPSQLAARPVGAPGPLHSPPPVFVLNAKGTVARTLRGCRTEIKMLHVTCPQHGRDPNEGGAALAADSCQVRESLA